MSSHQPPATWAYNLSALLEQRPELVGVGATRGCGSRGDERMIDHDVTPEYAQIIQRIRDEADLASRAGQYDRLNQIALDLEVLVNA